MSFGASENALQFCEKESPPHFIMDNMLQPNASISTMWSNTD